MLWTDLLRETMQVILTRHRHSVVQTRNTDAPMHEVPESSSTNPKSSAAKLHLLSYK